MILSRPSNLMCNIGRVVGVEMRKANGSLASSVVENEEIDISNGGRGVNETCMVKAYLASTCGVGGKQV